MKIELIRTKDGSHTLYRPDLDEYYHSVFGAIQESKHIYIENGFSVLSKSPLQVFEIGFGTGLNALLTWLKSAEVNKEVKYFSIEKFPLEPDSTRQLNYPSFLLTGSAAIFSKIHRAEWNTDHKLDHFVLHKIHADILDFEIPPGNDLVYFDAFSPVKEHLHWSEMVFHRLYDSMTMNGVLITYSAQGDVRRKLQSTGFITERLPGPPGKKHILRAVK